MKTSAPTTKAKHTTLEERVATMLSELRGEYDEVEWIAGLVRAEQRELLAALKAIYECGSIKEAEQIAKEAYAKATGEEP